MKKESWLRTEPNSLEEMMSWGMINKWVFDKVKHLTFEEAKKLIYSEYGIQTWSFQKSHIVEWLNKSGITPIYFDKNEFIRFVLLITKGKINPNEISSLYDEHKNHFDIYGMKSYKSKFPFNKKEASRWLS